MKLVVGLGNPGEKYQFTRHNAGYLALDALMKEFESENLEFTSKFDSKHLLHKGIILIKPETYMNSSGEAVSSFSRFYKISPSDIYIIHDDLDLRLGEYKIQQSVGPKVHGGINSIEEKLGTKEFWRVRIGVDNREPENRISGEEYVLQNFNEEELFALEKSIHKVVNELDSLFI